MKEEDLELLVTIDDPGEDTLEEDNFHHKPENKDEPSLQSASSSRFVDQE